MNQMMPATPVPEHRWLERLVGEWDVEETWAPEPGQPEEPFRGSERVRWLGEIWIVGESEWQMPGGGTAENLLTLGYDPDKKRYVGTWVCSPMTHLWVYHDAELDAAGNVLTLSAEGPSMTGEGTASYRDVITFKSDDHRTLTGHMLGEDGQWSQLMEAHYYRKT
ncbi:MAG: DUF1579 domain-containing protein [Phycisphaeraceae bacterium]